MIIDSIFYEITPNSWNQAKNLSKHISDSCIFRGHEDSSWELSTTLERAAIQFNCPPNELWKQEKLIINEFRSRAHQYISAPPKETEFIEWISIIQHYGGPTRLLDFTESFYIASFFAVETAKQDACVWGINYLIPLVKAITEEYYKAQTRDLLEQHSQVESLVESYIANKTKELDFVIRVTPYRKNERLATQKGTFLFPFNISKTFEQNLCHTFGYPFDSLVHENATKVYFKDLQKVNYINVGIIKINLPRAWHKEIMLDLDSMNINSASLFPGLDGFARSLRLFVRQMEQTPGELLDM